MRIVDNAARSIELAPAEAFRLAVAAARGERWREVLDLLTGVARRAETRGNLPGLFYSCLGVAVARCEGQRKEGVELCRYAVGIQPEEPDNHLHLATVYLMLGRRKAAVNSVAEGLELRSDHRRLLELRRRIGVRRPPPIRFLRRTNPLNVVIGQLRHRISAGAGS